MHKNIALALENITSLEVVSNRSNIDSKIMIHLESMVCTSNREHPFTYLSLREVQCFVHHSLARSSVIPIRSSTRRRKCVNPTLKNLGKQKKARNVFCLKSDKKEQEILLDIIDDSKMSLKNRQICKKRKQRTQGQNRGKNVKLFWISTLICLKLKEEKTLWQIFITNKKGKKREILKKLSFCFMFFIFTKGKELKMQTFNFWAFIMFFCNVFLLKRIKRKRAKKRRRHFWAKKT